jgi:hypothetical protein
LLASLTEYHTGSARRWPARDYPERRYLHNMLTRSLIAFVAGALLLPASAGAAPAPAGGSGRASTHALLSSHELWATIDVCNPADQANTIGIRGSMPGDGEAHDKMYMSFRLQYLSPTTKKWANLAGGASPGFVAVGSGQSARQDGRVFTLAPGAGMAPVQLRGVVDFQWRAGKKILLSASRPTAAGHVSLAGADPRNFTAATCMIG